jgi:hypothetical protein
LAEISLRPVPVQRLAAADTGRQVDAQYFVLPGHGFALGQMSAQELYASKLNNTYSMIHKSCVIADRVCCALLGTR